MLEVPQYGSVYPSHRSLGVFALVVADWLFQFQPRGLNPSSERWQANLGCWRNGGVFSTGVWPLLDNLEDPELRPLAQSLPATVLRSRADTCAFVIRLIDHTELLQKNFSYVGDNGEGDLPNEGHVVKDSNNCFTVWCTGRTGCDWMMAQLRLQRRQDLFTLLLSLVRPSPDTVMLTFQPAADDMDNIVLALGQKKTILKQSKGLEDLVCGLALDPLGNIHVAAYDSNTIKVFTKEGVYIIMYGDPIGPSGIAIDDEGYSLVSERDGNCLSIYDPDGNKIFTVGNLENPYGTALDPRDGSVFIANYGAGTVLKYCV
eukprot:Em0004g293a